MSWHEGHQPLPVPVYVSPLGFMDRYQMQERLHAHGWTTGIAQDTAGNVIMLVEGYSPASRVSVTLPPLETLNHEQAMQDTYSVIGHHLSMIGAGGHA